MKQKRSAGSAELSGRLVSSSSPGPWVISPAPSVDNGAAQDRKDGSQSGYGEAGLGLRLQWPCDGEKALERAQLLRSSLLRAKASLPPPTRVAPALPTLTPSTHPAHLALLLCKQGSRCQRGGHSEALWEELLEPGVQGGLRFTLRLCRPHLGLTQETGVLPPFLPHTSIWERPRCVGQALHRALLQPTEWSPGRMRQWG